MWGYALTQINSPFIWVWAFRRLSIRGGLWALSDQFFGSSLAVVASAMSNPFRYFNSSPEIIRLAVLMYGKYPLSLRNVEDLLAERGIDISHETVRFWWNRFGPMFAAEIRKKILCGWTAAGLGRLSFHTSMEATNEVFHLCNRCRGHRPRE